MNELSTEVKKQKLNIFQKIRLAMFRNKTFDIEKYGKAPDYIKKDNLVIDKFIHDPKYLNDETLLLIPSDKLEEFIENDTISLESFSKHKQIDFIMKKPELATHYLKDDLFDLVDIAVNNEKSEFSGILTYSGGKEYLYHLKDNNMLSETLPEILKYMNENIIIEVLEQKIDLINSLNEEQQVAYINKHPETLKHINSQLQWNYTQENPDSIKNASDEIQEKFILSDKNNLSKTSDEFQLKTICEHPNAYNYASDSIRYRVFKDVYDPLCIKATRSLLKKDIKNSRYLDLKGLNVVHIDSYKPMLDLFKDINMEDSETIKRLFLYSKLMSAKGKLLSSNETLHGSKGEPAPIGIDDYTPEQISIIHSLNTNQIKDLIEIDSNYVLPYLAGPNLVTELKAMSQNEIESSKERCKKLFISIFGDDKLKELESCIDIVYSKQLNEQDEIYDKTPKGEVDYKKVEFSKIQSSENIPLDHFKLLFNKNIISSNSSEKIKEYFEKLQSGEDTNQLFRQLMENAYGKECKEILESRPGLNVHTINSLETFDKGILDNFEIGFVHDLLSYNIREFSGFLSVIKNESRLENFKTYYEVLSNIMGTNVETMQRAISEFIYNEDLLKDVSNIDLTDKQYQNLISVLCSRENEYNINNIEDLSNYNEIANKKSKKELSKSYNKYLLNRGKLSNAYAIEPIKKCICEETLGLDWRRDYLNRNYGDSYKYIMSLYDLQSEISKEERYAENELEILNVMNFLDKENDPEKLMELANSLFSQENIRNPIELYSTIDKIKEHQLEIFNESLLTVDKMEELCKVEEEKEKPLIKKSMIEEVPVYELKGVPFNILLHSTGGLTLQEFLDYDGQLGNNAICSRNISDRVIGEGRTLGSFGFTYIEEDGGIISNSGSDANTNHISKLVRGTGRIDSKINKEINSAGGETAFYRRYRNHKNVTNENHGGKRLPDVFVAWDVVDKKTLEFLRKNKIPIVRIDVEAYKKLDEEKSIQNDNNLERE